MTDLAFFAAVAAGTGLSGWWACTWLVHDRRAHRIRRHVRRHLDQIRREILS